MDDPNQPLLPEPPPEDRKLDVGNLMLGCLNGVGVAVAAIAGFFAFALEEPVGGFVGVLATIGLVVVLIRQHSFHKRRSYLLGALLFIGFAGLCFGLCVALLVNASFQ